MAFQPVSQEWRLSGLCNGNDTFDVGRLEQEEEAQAKGGNWLEALYLSIIGKSKCAYYTNITKDLSSNLEHSTNHGGDKEAHG